MHKGIGYKQYFEPCINENSSPTRLLMTHKIVRFEVPATLSDAVSNALHHLPFDTILEDDTGLTTSLPTEQWSTEIELAVRLVAEAFGVALRISEEIAKDYNAVWEQSFEPYSFDDFCSVRASFHPPSAVHKYELVIDPRMAFGTGHHETTDLMIGAMRDHPFDGKCVVDFGAGTGILGILATKMGAAKTYYYENDPTACVNLRENILLNETADTAIVIENTHDTLLPSEVDFMLVNITRNVILAYLKEIVQAVATGGLLNFSGFVLKDADVVLAEGTKLGLTAMKQDSKGEWSFLQMMKR